MASFPGATPGTIIFRDLNGDGTLTEQLMRPEGDFAVLGDSYPDFTVGVTNAVSIGNVDVRALFTGEFGGDNLRAEFFRTARNIDGLFVVDAEYVEDFWRSPEDPGDGLTPTPLGGATPRQQYRDVNHSLVLSDASHIWLRNLLVRYNFQSGMLAGANIYASASNLFILSPYPGNPDVVDMTDGQNQPGLDFGNYPVPRTLTLGIELSL